LKDFSKFAEKSNKHMFLFNHFLCHDFAKIYIKMEEILNKRNFQIRKNKDFLIFESGSTGWV
jgi:hypothetical protein